MTCEAFCTNGFLGPHDVKIGVHDRNWDREKHKSAHVFFTKGPAVIFDTSQVSLLCGTGCGRCLGFEWRENNLHRVEQEAFKLRHGRVLLR